MTEAEKEKAKELRSTGLSWKEVADTLGFSLQTMFDNNLTKDGKRSVKTVFPNLREWMYKNKRSVSWLSEQLGISPVSMNSKMNRRTELKKWEIDRILEITGLPYEICFKEDA